MKALSKVNTTVIELTLEVVKLRWFETTNNSNNEIDFASLEGLVSMKVDNICRSLVSACLIIAKTVVANEVAAPPYLMSTSQA